MKPAIAIVGRPNVGKSTLFNRLTTSRDALVADRAGVTRDRQYGVLQHDDRSFFVIDTGGIGQADHDSQEVAGLMLEQSMLAAQEAVALIWVVDGRTGLTAVDESLAVDLRKLDKPIFVAVNKTEGYETLQLISDFYQFGMAHVFPISSKRGDGVDTLLAAVVATIKPVDDEEETVTGTVIGLLGRPNAGKSTLVNRLLGSTRMLTFDRPGTTRDSIKVPLKRHGKDYTLIDTAGVRRKSRVHDTIEKFSILKSLAVIDAAQIIILVLDATEGATEQDATLLGMVADSGKSVIIAMNKWDGMTQVDKKRVKALLAHKFSFIDYAEYHFISALHGTGVGDLLKTVNKIERSLALTVSTADITNLLAQAIAAHPPSMIQGRRVKLRYAHLGGTDPIRIIVHGNQIDKLPSAYKRYLANAYRKALKLVATTVLLDFKQGQNPFKDKKNTLTARQVSKRKRLIKHVKRR